MDMPHEYETMVEKRMKLEEIARKSSLDMMPPAPFIKLPSYPVPYDLKLALELKKTDRLQTEESQCYSQVLMDMEKFKNINADRYWYTMQLVLYLDHHQCNENMIQYSLYNQILMRSKYNASMVVLYVPGLEEGRPSVTLKDTVIIQQANGCNRAVGMVVAVGRNYITARVTYGFVHCLSDDQVYNIHFVYPDYSINCKHFAVDRVMHFNLIPLLFPVEKPRLEHTLYQAPALNWINRGIGTNPEQQQAILQIMDKSAYPAPYILFGPPGTGKTSTLVEAIAQLLITNPCNRILVCTPSNAAADEVVLRLMKSQVDGYNILRMYSGTKDGNLVNNVLKPFSNAVREKTILTPREILMSKKVVVTTLITCHRLIAYDLDVNHFTYVFVDEAGQATEPETLIPMTLMSSNSEDHSGRLHGQLVIAGDPKQLGPIVTSRIAEKILGRSMLERLMNWDLYRKDENNKFNPMYVTKLVQNYRCHPAILHVPNELFYDGELKAYGGKHTEKAMLWDKLPSPNFPIIFHAIEASEEREATSPSVYNPAEVATIITYVRDLLDAKFGGQQVRQADIGIVTPYKLQKQKICTELRKNNWTDIDVGTVELFQGREKDIIIVSTVRSGLYRHDDRIHAGLLSNPKRFNVALTRAKALLIVIGNPVVLQVDECWEKFLSYCVENGACRGSKFKLKMVLTPETVKNHMAQKHIRRNDWLPNAPYEIDEKPPVEEQTYQLPEMDPTRRRRLPDGPSPTEIICSNQIFNYAYEAYRDEIIFESNLAYPKADYDLKIDYSYSYMSNRMTPPDNYIPLNHPENSLEDASSTTTTDQSDKSSDYSEDIDVKRTGSIETTSEARMREELFNYSLSSLSL